VFQFPAWWAMGGWAPARTIDAAYFVFLLGWFLTTAAITVYFHRDSGTNPALRRYRVYAPGGLLAASVLFTLAVLGSDAYRHARSDLAERAAPWDAYMRERYALIADAVAGGRLSLIVPDYDRPYPRTIYFNDIMHDSHDWRNGCYASYFGLDSIKRAKAPAQ